MHNKGLWKRAQTPSINRESGAENMQVVLFSQYHSEPPRPVWVTPSSTGLGCLRYGTIGMGPSTVIGRGLPAWDEPGGNDIVHNDTLPDSHSDQKLHLHADPLIRQQLIPLDLHLFP